MAVHYALRDAGIPRRANNSAWLDVYPRIKVICSSCGRSFKRREFHFVHGNGVKSAPNPPAERFCSSACKARGHSRWLIERARRKQTIQVDYC
jgi:endogenous inhibitor of DNA gyrase (YacG/DUF329 family)